jgi:hypothetical protein
MPRQSHRAYGQERAPNGRARAASDRSGWSVASARSCWTLIRIALLLAPRGLLQVALLVLQVDRFF